MAEPASRFALGSFARGDCLFLGVVLDDTVIPVSSLDPARFAADITLRVLLEDWPASFDALQVSLASKDVVDRIPLAELRVLAPLPDPRQIFCTGANYGSHLVEMIVAVGFPPHTDGMDARGRQAIGSAFAKRQAEEGAPFVFMKPVTSVAGPFDDLVLPAFSEQADWELELGAVIGRATHRVAYEQALDHVAGYMVVNDLTARDKVNRTDPGALGRDWLGSKGAPGFLPIGPWFVPSTFVPDPQALTMRLIVNGVTMQDGHTGEMTFDVAEQISFIAERARMLPGDILCTGSPAGNGIAKGIFLKEGDVMESEIEGLGRQIVRCIGPAGA